MSAFLDWITINAWVVAVAAIVFAVVGYTIARPAALRGKANDDPSPWDAFCMRLFPDTRSAELDDDGSITNSHDTGVDNVD